MGHDTFESWGEELHFISGDEQSGGIFQWSGAGDAAIPHHEAWLGADVRRAKGGDFWRSGKGRLLTSLTTI